MSETQKLPFGRIERLENGIFELVLDEGVELDAAIAREILEAIRTCGDPTYSILINRVHAFSDTADAYRQLHADENLRAVATVAYRTMTEIAARLLKHIPGGPDRYEVFPNHELALKWLREQ